MISERIKLARLANCLSLQQLADKMKLNGVPMTKTTLFNYESGAIQPPDQTLSVFAQTLGVNTSFFEHRPPEQLQIELRNELNAVEARKQEILAYIQIQIEQLLQLAGCVGLNLTKRFNEQLTYTVNSEQEAEEAADRIRKELGLGTYPISSVCGLLERIGFYVFTIPDTFQWAFLSGRETASNVHFIFASQNLYLDDFRFDLLKEFGRNVLVYPTEKEAAILKRFAASMLMPSEAVISEFGAARSSIGYEEMRCSKQKYGLSRTIMLNRLAECGILSEQNAFLLQQRLVQNYHISRTSMQFAPLNFYEKPSMMYMLVHRAISEGYLQSENELSFITSIALY